LLGRVGWGEFKLKSRIVFDFFLSGRPLRCSCIYVVDPQLQVTRKRHFIGGGQALAC